MIISASMIGYLLSGIVHQKIHFSISTAAAEVLHIAEIGRNHSNQQNVSVVVALVEIVGCFPV